jgi:hypothetical protein
MGGFWRIAAEWCSAACGRAAAQGCASPLGRVGARASASAAGARRRFFHGGGARRERELLCAGVRRERATVYAPDATRPGNPPPHPASPQILTSTQGYTWRAAGPSAAAPPPARASGRAGTGHGARGTGHGARGAGCGARGAGRLRVSEVEGDVARHPQHAGVAWVTAHLRGPPPALAPRHPLRRCRVCNRAPRARRRRRRPPRLPAPSRPSLFARSRVRRGFRGTRQPAAAPAPQRQARPRALTHPPGRAGRCARGRAGGAGTWRCGRRRGRAAPS